MLQKPSSQCCPKAPRQRGHVQQMALLPFYTWESGGKLLCRWVSGIGQRHSKRLWGSCLSGFSFFWVSAKARGHEPRTWEKRSRSEPSVQALSLWSSQFCSEVAHGTVIARDKGEMRHFQHGSVLPELRIYSVPLKHVLLFYSFPGVSSGLSTPWKSSRMGEWNDAESPSCPNVFPDYWIVAIFLSACPLKVLDQNRQDMASKHSTFKTERMQFQQPCLFELNGLYVTSDRTAEVFFSNFYWLPRR